MAISCPTSVPDVSAWSVFVMNSHFCISDVYTDVLLAFVMI